MQFPGQGKPPVAIIFDSAMGQRIDDALALALLYGFDGRNEARLVSVSTSRSNLASAAFCDAVGRFYAGAVSGAFGGSGRTLPVGLSDSGKMPDDTPMVAIPSSKYPHNIRKRNDTAEPTALIRNAFTAQNDQNSVVVLTGPATDLANVLDLPGAKELIARKVKFLSVAVGAYPEGPPEFNIATDIAAAKKLFADWPTPIFAAGREIGDAVSFPASSIEKDFAWSAAHPVVEAYRAYKAMPYDSPTWAMAAALYAVRPQEGYFKPSEAGTIRVLDDGGTRFALSPDGKHHYLIPDPEQKERILKLYTEVASAKPVVRPPRFPQQQKQEPPKPVKQ
jgi:inosine-uridine nucleoside N-ribohydrolase